MSVSHSPIERSPQPMAATEGPDHTIRQVSRAFCELVGRNEQELIGHPIVAAAPGFLAASVLVILDRVYLTGVRDVFTTRWVTDSRGADEAPSFAVWTVCASTGLPRGLAIQIGESNDAESVSGRKALATDEIREINERLLIAGIHQHELAAAATKALDRERAIADALQYFLLLEEPAHAFPGCSLATIYEPALTEALVGGDFFDAFRLPNGNIMFAVGDVTGKGLKAAARTVEVKYALRAFAHDYEAPEDVALHLNNYICAQHPANDRDYGQFIAIVLALFNPVNGAMQFMSGGAEPPFIVRASGATEEISTSGMMLGIEHGTTYTPCERWLHSGDVTVLTTDGITESRRKPLGDIEFFGSAGIAKVVRQASDTARVRDIGKSIVDAAREHAGGSFQDDVCILLVRRD